MVWAVSIAGADCPQMILPPRPCPPGMPRIAWQPTGTRSQPFGPHVIWPPGVTRRLRSYGSYDAAAALPSAAGAGERFSSVRVAVFFAGLVQLPSSSSAVPEGHAFATHCPLRTTSRTPQSNGQTRSVLPRSVSRRSVSGLDGAAASLANFANLSSEDLVSALVHLSSIAPEAHPTRDSAFL